MNRILEFGNKDLIVIDHFRVSIFQTLILIIGLLVIFFLEFFNHKYVKKGKWLENLDSRLRNLISQGLSYLIWVIGLVAILRLEDVNTKLFFKEEIFSISDVAITVQKVFIFIVIVFIVRLIVLIIDFFIGRKVQNNNLDYGKTKSVQQIVKYFIWIAGILIGIGSLGLKLTFIIASVSALLVGVGFGLQNIFNDFFSGIIILFDGSIKVKDIVQVGDVVGRVKEIGIRTTKVLNRDNIILIIPNSKFTTDSVINWSLMDKKSRFNVSVGVAYGSDVRLVEKILMECADECKDVEQNPKPFVRFENFGDSSLDFKLYFWTSKSFTVENTKSFLRFTIDEKFRENNISIPFPQRDIHIKTKV